MSLSENLMTCRTDLIWWQALRMSALYKISNVPLMANVLKQRHTIK